MSDERRRQPPADGERVRYFPATHRFRHVETMPRARGFVRRTCIGCGQSFGASRVHARWCSDACRKRGKR